jgi:D-alanine-D-alanine ligase
MGSDDGGGGCTPAVNGRQPNGRKAARKSRRDRQGSNGGRALGPVASLQAYVASDWWRRIFNSLYLKTDGDVVDDDDITRSEVATFVQVLGLNPKDRVLDLCCGQGRHSLELARRGFSAVEGLDRSHYLIQRARSRAQKETIDIRFREGDARKLPHPADTFDAVLLLGNSFGYFETVEEDLLVLREVFRVLKPWGRLLIDVADGDYIKAHLEPHSWEWIDEKHFVCRERSLSADGERLISREIITNAGTGVIADQFYAERLYNRVSITDLIRRAGFVEVSFPGELVPDSKRAQDLGMMAKRLVVTAEARKAWAPVRRRDKGERDQVVVVMGDPRRVDPLKPAGVFDEDDLYTIDRLKSALAELPEYAFTYLDDHGDLAERLARLRGKVNLVFNVCDEGYDNDPRKELHVPALLEVLGLPYTGASPRCLACCYDKSMVRGVCREMGVPTAEAVFIKAEDSAFLVPFDFPVLVKPNFGDSSFGITARSVCHSAEELSDAILATRSQFGYDKPLIIEEFLAGKDLSVGIVGNPPDAYTILPIVEEDYSVLPADLPRICGYEAKWLPDSPYWKIHSIPAELPEEVAKDIMAWCLQLFERLECRDYARFDWRLDAEGNPHLLEVNPNPGWCWDGHLNKMAGLAGWSYADLLRTILEAAKARIATEAQKPIAVGPDPAQLELVLNGVR